MHCFFTIAPGLQAFHLKYIVPSTWHVNLYIFLSSACIYNNIMFRRNPFLYFCLSCNWTWFLLWAWMCGLCWEINAPTEVFGLGYCSGQWMMLLFGTFWCPGLAANATWSTFSARLLAGALGIVAILIQEGLKFRYHFWKDHLNFFQPLHLG